MSNDQNKKETPVITMNTDIKEPGLNITVGEPEQKPQVAPKSTQPIVRTRVLRNKQKASVGFLEIMIWDFNEYLISIDYVRISSIDRVTYNAIHNELTLIFSDVTGRIGDQPVRLEKQHAEEGKEEYRFAIRGEVTSFKHIINRTDEIKDFLSVYTAIPLDKGFIGFDAYKKAQEKIKELTEKRMKEEAEAKQTKPADQ